MLQRVPGGRRWPLPVALLAIVLLLGGAAYWLRARPRPGGSALPAPGSPRYRDTVSAFYLGTLALRAGVNVAGEQLSRATRLAPGEPAAWANLGLFYLRQNDLAAAARGLETARRLAPGESQIEAMIGLLADRQGRFDEAVALLRRAVERDPTNLRARGDLADLLRRQNTPDADAEAERQWEAIRDAQPGNLYALLPLAQLAAKRGDRAALESALGGIAAHGNAFSPAARERLGAIRALAAGPNPRAAAAQMPFLENLLKPTFEYRQGILAVRGEPGLVGAPLARFLKLAPPPPAIALPDTGLTFTSESLAGMQRSAVAVAVPLGDQSAPAVFGIEGGTLRRADAPGGAALPAPGGLSAEGILALDWSYDYRTDLALAGAGGFRLFRQESKGARFTDVTARAGLPAAITRGAYSGAWTGDIEADGDLDIVLGTKAGPPPVLRNNGDGTFTVLHPFGGISGLRAWAWADLDDDGDVDAGAIDGGGVLHVFANQRSGLFRERPVPGIGAVAAVTVADVDNDGTLDLVVAGADGTIRRLSDRREGEAWDAAEIARGNDTARVFVADIDNNAGNDLVLSGSRDTSVRLADGKGGFVPLAAPLAAPVFSVADHNGDGRLDLVGVADGRPVVLANRGTKAYGWQIVRPRAEENKQNAVAQGKLINPFGVGGDIAVVAGTLSQRQPITGPVVHFGLGENGAASAVLATWPNGTLRGEFPEQTARDRTIVVQQTLIASCPFLFAWDGTAMRFLTDCIWRSPLGLKINALDTAEVMQTEDWVKIQGDQLVPRNGVYDLRITADLWETHFFDHVSLMTVDHPAGTEIWVDERLAFPQPPLRVYATAPPRPFRAVRDDRGSDVSAIVRSRDARYLDSFGRGPYQGVTRDHWVEMELDDAAPRSGPLYLIAHGWIHPTNSSINVAIGQGRHDPPRGLSLEVPDGRGGWKTARPGLGFPEGKVKTVVIDLENVFQPDTPRRLRLRTNLEIYWDSVAWAQGLPQTSLIKRRLDAGRAELRYRGFSFIDQADASSPELPQYDQIQTRGARWRDLIGYYTRFGDVRELLRRVDDRYVIMNAGDEMAFEFAALPAPPPGWTRDYVLIGDGWVKDGNLNTTFSKTVLPLPAHDLPRYDTPPGRLEDDPVYRRHRRDWDLYHTRYVAPRAEALTPRPPLPGLGEGAGG